MAKPTKPLLLHRNGQWYKKIRGKFYYFGKDEAEALAKWEEQGPFLLSGFDPPIKDGSPSLQSLANVYLHHCESMCSSGELSRRHVDGVRRTLRRLTLQRGPNSQPALWTTNDFLEIRKSLAEPAKRAPALIEKGLSGRTVETRSMETVAGDIRRIKAFLNWASSDDVALIGPPRYGKNFTVSRKALRSVRNLKGRLDLPAKDIQLVLSKCSVRLKPIVLLGINGGMGARDISNLTLRQITRLGDDGFLVCPRGKTGGYRRFWLWPETIAAIKSYLKERPEPSREEWAHLAFLTGQGNAWVTEVVGKCKDSIGWGFGRAVGRAGIQRGSFYDLRRTFETVASETLDQPAVNLVMGHVPPADDMAARYLQHIANERVQSVCQHVRQWLYS